MGVCLRQYSRTNTALANGHCQVLRRNKRWPWNLRAGWIPMASFWKEQRLPCLSCPAENFVNLTHENHQRTQRKQSSYRETWQIIGQIEWRCAFPWKSREGKADYCQNWAAEKKAQPLTWVGIAAKLHTGSAKNIYCLIYSGLSMPLHLQKFVCLCH